MEIEQYISSQPLERQNILTEIHKIIIDKDKSVEAGVESMMGKEMIIYKVKGVMKYALSGVKKHMSLHLMPIYGYKPLHIKYEELLSTANFQKGCINFKNDDEVPLNIVQNLVSECSSIDLAKIKEDCLKSKKVKDQSI